MSLYGSPIKKPYGINYIKSENYTELENELKMKSLYLAKSAHELKNVFLTISSIIENNGICFFSNTKNIKNESNDNNYNLSNTNNFLKSLCNFGMSLIYEITQMSKNDGNFITMKSNIVEYYNLYNCLYFCIHIFESRLKFERKTFDIKFNFNISKHTTIKSISEMRLKQVVINLLSNSFKFTIKGSIILSVEKIKEKIRIKITDTGIGFDMKNNQNIFNPFEMIDKNQYLNKNGSGLGLYICKEILEINKSKLNFFSQKGKGSIFYFDLIDDDEEIINPSLILNDNLKSIIFSINQGKKDNNKEFKNEEMKIIINDKKEYNENNYNKYENKSNYDELSSQNNFIFRKVQTINFFSNNFSKNNIKFHSIEEDNNNSSIMKSRNSKKKKLSIGKAIINLNLNGEINRTYSQIQLKNNKKDFFKNKSNIRCLICDDDSYTALSIRKLILKYFEKDEKNIPDIIYVPNGIECLHIVYLNLLSNNPINVIIMDQNMPFLNGFYTCKVLKNIQEMNDIKIFLQSSELININECLANGFYDKPLSMNAIRDIFKEK